MNFKFFNGDETPRLYFTPHRFEAENVEFCFQFGGEVYIEELGYWLDGYDNLNNVVIEYYEKHHKKQITKDEKRKKEIIDFLKCKFIEIWE